MRKIASKKRVVRAYVFNAQYAKIIAYLSSGFNRVKERTGVIFLTANTRKKSLIYSLRLNAYKRVLGCLFQGGYYAKI